MSSASGYELNIQAVSSEPSLSSALDIKSSDVEPIVEESIAGFAKYYQEVLGNSALSPFEKAAIKTYLYWAMFINKTP